MTTVSAAVIQAAPVAFDVDATLDKAQRLAAEAAGADLLVFPEAFVSASTSSRAAPTIPATTRSTSRIPTPCCAAAAR